MRNDHFEKAHVQPSEEEKGPLAAESRELVRASERWSDFKRHERERMALQVRVEAKAQRQDPLRTAARHSPFPAEGGGKRQSHPHGGRHTLKQKEKLFSLNSHFFILASMAISRI